MWLSWQMLRYDDGGRKVKRPSCIYVMKNSIGFVKIGVSLNPEHRAKSLQTGSCYQIVSLYFTEPCYNAYCLEKLAHDYFRSVKEYGEWYNCSFEEAKNLVSILFQNGAQLESIPNETKVTLNDISNKFEEGMIYMGTKEVSELLGKNRMDVVKEITKLRSSLLASEKPVEEYFIKRIVEDKNDYLCSKAGVILLALTSSKESVMPVKIECAELLGS